MSVRFALAHERSIFACLHLFLPQSIWVALRRVYIVSVHFSFFFFFCFIFGRRKTTTKLQMVDRLSPWSLSPSSNLIYHPNLFMNLHILKRAIKKKWVSSGTDGFVNVFCTHAFIQFRLIEKDRIDRSKFNHKTTINSCRALKSPESIIIPCNNWSFSSGFYCFCTKL